jgi:hypothetical protein
MGASVRYSSLVLFFLSLMCISPALASPREDSLAGISRCASLPDDRTFLDCIYGAVQPLRAQLGLPPALAAQQRLVPPASPYLTRSGPPPTAQASLPAQPAPQNQSGNLFSGLFGNGLHMASYTFDRRGFFTVTLSDGSVWQQDPGDTNFAHFAGKPAAYSVIVHSGDFGRSRLDVRGEPGPYLVNRIH